MPASQVHGFGERGFARFTTMQLSFRFVRGARCGPVDVAPNPAFCLGHCRPRVPPVFRLPPPPHTITGRPHRTALSTVHDGLCRLRRAARRRGGGRRARKGPVAGLLRKPDKSKTTKKHTMFHIVPFRIVKCFLPPLFFCCPPHRESIVTENPFLNQLRKVGRRIPVSDTSPDASKKPPRTPRRAKENVYTAATPVSPFLFSPLKFSSSCCS